MMYFIPIHDYNIQIMHHHNFVIHAQYFIYMLLLKYFVIIKKEKIAEVASLQEVLQKEGRTSVDLRATLEEERKRAEAEVFELKAQISTPVSEAMVRAVEEFKTSYEMRDLKVEFGQATFIKGFVAPWIDFDDYKVFEGVLMIFT